MNTSRLFLATTVADMFKADPNDGLAILGDAMLQYRSTDAHNARGIEAAIMALHVLTRPDRADRLLKMLRDNPDMSPVAIANVFEGKTTGVATPPKKS